MSIRDQILSKTFARQFQPVVVPEWGVTVHVPVMTVAEAAEVNAIVSDKGAVVSIADIAARVTRDEYGNRVFTDDDAEALAQQPNSAVKRIIDAFVALNGTDDAEKK